MRRDKTRNYGWLRRPLLAGGISMMLLVLLLAGWSGNQTDMQKDIWEPFRWTGKKSIKTDGSAKVLMAKAEDIMKQFHKVRPFNPPDGYALEQIGEFLPRVTIPGNRQGPEPLMLRIRIRRPPEGKDIIAGVNIYVNDPYNIVGDPVISDKTGDIFLMPPQVGRKSGQPIYTRWAHPPGYEEKYPSFAMFPLWSSEVEPFLRSVVRPTFALSKATVTTMFTSGDRPFWKPVSQERWITAMIGKAQADLDELSKGFEAAEKTDVTSQQITQMRDYLKRVRAANDDKVVIERHNKMMEQLRANVEMAKSMGMATAEAEKTMVSYDMGLDAQLEAAAEMRSSLDEYETKLIKALITRDDTWKNAAESIRQGDWDSLESLGKEYEIEKLIFLADAGRALEKLQIELKSLSPAQRSSPAYGFELPPYNPQGTQRQVVMMPFNAKRQSGLVDAGAKGARALVSLDPDFFAFDEKNGPIRIISVEWWGSNEIMYESGNRNILDDLWSSLEWSSLKKFL
ncbi:MAG: hypothetical protein R6W67_09540 [Bacteroidales bacterium]